MHAGYSGTHTHARTSLSRFYLYNRAARPDKMPCPARSRRASQGKRFFDTHHDQRYETPSLASSRREGLGREGLNGFAHALLLRAEGHALRVAVQQRVALRVGEAAGGEDGLVRLLAHHGVHDDVAEQFRLLPRADADVRHGPREVEHDLLRHDAVLLVRRVVRHELAHPLRDGEDAAGGAVADELEVPVELGEVVIGQPHRLEVGLHEWHEAGEIPGVRAVEDLVQGHLIGLVVRVEGARTHHDALTPTFPLLLVGGGLDAVPLLGLGAVLHDRREPLAEEELLRARRVAEVRAAHILVDLRQRRVEREVEGEDRAREQHDEDGEGRVLEVRGLDLHGPELHAPADGPRLAVGHERRRLPAHRLPVGALDGLEVLRGRVVVHLAHVAVEDDQRIARKEVREVAGEHLIEAVLHEQRLGLLVDGARDVVEALHDVARLDHARDLGAARPRRVGVAGVDVPRDGVVAGLVDAAHAPAGHLRVARAAVRRGRRLAALRGRAVVAAHADDIPANVRVHEAALEDGRPRREREHDGRHHGELVVHVAGLGEVARLEGDLEAAAAHAVGHGVHLDGGLGSVRRGALGELGRALVPEERQLDVHVGAPARADVPRERAEARVRVDDRVRDGLRVGDGPARRRPRLAELAHAQQREVHHVGRDLVRRQRREQPPAPQAHVALHGEEVRNGAAVGRPRRRLDHPRAVLLVPHDAVVEVHVLRLEPVQLLHDVHAAQVRPHAAPRRVELQDRRLHLVAPLELVVLDVPHGAVRLQELQQPVAPDVAHVLLAILPGHRLAHLQEAHGRGRGEGARRSPSLSLRPGRATGVQGGVAARRRGGVAGGGGEAVRGEGYG
mmetsp:Transcript_17107/g.52532  ORF Transcript_17107/g.52532 Transcript_17107/m.52532 type:complete len:846 (+) Transcript_17107:2023-4560(+)